MGVLRVGPKSRRGRRSYRGRDHCRRPALGPMGWGARVGLTIAARAPLLRVAGRGSTIRPAMTAYPIKFETT